VAEEPAPRLGVPGRLVGAVLPGTTLNPLNSSMIAVALIDLQQHFDVGVAQSTWLVSGFYLASAVGQPVMGRLVDLFGARRLFVSGLVLVFAVSLAAPFAPGFWWLVGLRALQGIGTSAAYPSALVLFRAAAPSGPPPSGAIAALGVSAASSAALGPVLGGVLVALAGWQALFVVNLPLTVLGVVLALRVLPTTPARGRLELHELDLPGVALFTAAITTLLVFLLSLAEDPSWWLAPVSVASVLLLVLRERATATPFLDVRGLVANRTLSSLLLQQGGVNLVFYALFFGLPLWLEAVRGFSTERVGLLMLPFTILSLLVTPVAARAIGRYGSKPALVVGSVLVVIGTGAVQLLGNATPVVVLVLITVVLGIPNSLNNLGLQTGLYAAAPPDRTGASGGLFQTFRYLGAIMASSLLGIVLERDLSTDGLHQVGLVITGVAIVLLVLSTRLPRLR
jgi:MFS family permease